jgi:hypothetical protein
MEIKQCVYCKKTLPVSMFDISYKNADGYESTCKECKIKRHEYYERNKEKILKKSAEYTAAHKEEKAARDKRYALEHKEQLQKYHKEYRESHKEANAEYQKQYRVKNKDKLDEYKKAPHIRYKVYQSNARVKDRNFNLTEDEFIQISTQPCIYCGEYSDTYNGDPFNGVDRVDSNLGYSIDNCVPCCATCNRMKMDLDVNDWVSKMKQIINHYCN